MAVSILVVLASLVALSTAKTYTGYTVITCQPETADQLKVLQAMRDTDAYGIDFWSEPVHMGENVTFCLPPDVFPTITFILEKYKLDYYVLVEDLQHDIDKEKEENIALHTLARLQGRTFSLNQYNTHSDMNNYLQEVADSCQYCSLVDIGTSHEGRAMKAIKMSKGEGRYAIWIDAGIHAREWVAPAIALYIIDKLVNEPQNDFVTQALMDTFDWYILPSHNPDGYEYSRLRDRMWRKTRKPNPGTHCVGTDPNRNWGFHWMETGASSNPCSDVYGGSEAFSEVETRNVRDFVLSIPKPIAFLTFHAYGQYWLTPWGYTPAYPDDYDVMRKLANVATEALQSVHGTRYTVGSSTNVLYAAAGGSDDWAKGVAHIKFAYTVELRDNGYHGFLLPANQIEATGQETWAGVKAMMFEIRKKIVERSPE